MRADKLGYARRCYRGAERLVGSATRRLSEALAREALLGKGLCVAEM